MSPSTIDADRNVRIAVATEFAELFIKEAAKQIHGHPNQMPRAAAQTVKAIEMIDPIGDFTAVVEPDDSVCECGHEDWWHEDETNYCFFSSCVCGCFKKKETPAPEVKP